jgi:putative ABC transport system permease protein
MYGSTATNRSAAIRSAVSEVDPGIAASSPRTLESLWTASLGSRRANVRLLQAFGSVALVLCAIGVYGVAAFVARTRRREPAIRAALGAGRYELTITTLRSEMQPVFVGLVLGLVIAMILAPAIFAGAFAISPRDLRTYLEVAAILTAVAIVASYLPIRRAAAISPSDALAP